MIAQSARPTRPWLDISGLALSAACIVHCLALPVVASLLPALGAWAEAEWVHWLFIAVAAPVAYIALLRPGRRATPLAIVLAIAGLAFLVLGALGWPTHDAEAAMTVVGGLALAGAHIVNRLGRRSRPLQA